MGNTIKELKAIYKAVNSWIKDYNRIDYLSVEDIIQLKEKLEKLPLISDPYIDTLNKGSIMYCICQDKEFGNMISCDYCKRWFHLQCFDLAEEKTDLFICPECLVYYIIIIR